MENQKSGGRGLTPAILSLSLLTVMAGAAVAPALGVIQAYFAGTDPLFVQMIVSIPAIFIVLTSLFFPRLCARFGSRTLVLAGLVLYTAGGCAAGAFGNIFLVLAARALVGVGVGIVMPLSTGLLVFYYPPERQERLMGWSSAMNQMGGAVATLLSGLLCAVSWRASFLVYLLGLVSIVLCARALPNYRISAPDGGETAPKGLLRENFPFLLCMFLLMTAFFTFPSSYAMAVTARGTLPTVLIAPFMAAADVVAFFGGLAFVHVKRALKGATRFFAPALFLLGYALLSLSGARWAALAGPCLVGFANGVGIPFLISAASRRAGRLAAATVMPMLSAALYLSQFLMPVLLSAVTALTGCTAPEFPFVFGAGAAAALLLCCFTLPREDVRPESR